MVVFPGCKINIGLNIKGKREDNYHNLESIFFPIKLTDILEIVKSDVFSIQLSGLNIDGEVKNNLIVKAFELLKAEYNLSPISIHLHKIVPMGAGLGGGSADGAATLLILNRIFNLKIPLPKLEKLADKLGSDSAFFIRNTPAYVTGKGEIIDPIDLNLDNYTIHLINPGIHINTKRAFKDIGFTENTTSLKNLILMDANNWSSKINNDFEKTVFPIYPEIEKIKTQLYQNGAIYASMTGTGSSVYGIFKKKPSKSFPNYFEWISE